MKLKVALLQIMPEGDLLETGKTACRKAAKMGADIALFPEMWSCGYSFSADNVKELAITAENGFIQAFGELARELDMAIAITFLEKQKTGFPMPRNSVALFDRNGELKFVYAKVHTCDFGDEKVLSHGEEFYVCDLDTKGGNVKVGAMICYDREFPESARILMLKGAEIVLVPNACPMEINRLSQLRGRAYENMMGIATCNYPSGKPDCNGHSSAFDGVAYLPSRDEASLRTDCGRNVSGDTPRDMCILEADESEGIYLAEFDIDMIREYREREVHGNAYRRPELYGLLVSEEKREPFVREDFNK